MHHHTENEERSINQSLLAVSRPGEFSRVESNEAARSTLGGALPSIASCFRLVTMLLPEPGSLISRLDPSWFELRPFPRVKGTCLRLDFKGPESMPDGMGCHLPMKLREENSELNHSDQRTRRLRRRIVGASNTDFHQIHIITWLVWQVVRCNDASLSLDRDKQGLQSVFPVNWNCLLVHSVTPESNFPVFLRSHPDTMEMTARYDGACR